jgi:YbbR domain-containing protein
MKNKTTNFFSNRWFYRLTALVFAILLFVYVNGGKLGDVRKANDNGTNSSLTSTKTKTITMPLELTVNSDKYVVTGYPETVKVTLTGPAALVTTTSNTQNFKVYVDLNHYSIGKHKVAIKQTGLNKDLNYKIKPDKISVNIENRKTVTMPVDVVLNQKKVADGYKIGKPTSSIQNVKVTGSVSEVNKVDRVVASISITNNAKKDVNRHVTLQAIDKDGNTVSVVVTPQTTNVVVPITSTDSNSTDSSSANKTSTKTESTSSSSESNSSESRDDENASS